MATPHISAEVGDFAPTVLMPGDPQRAQHIAENFLADAKLVTDVRAMKGYTGTWNGAAVSVMPSGMGVPSAAIYLTELARFYQVERIIRVGTAGVYSPDVQLREIVAADEAVTNSGLPASLGADGPLVPNGALLSTAQRLASDTGLSLRTGTVFTSDIFYEPGDEMRLARTADGVLCVEMEAAALYACGACEGFDALALFTMTDHLVTGEHLSSTERLRGVDEMIELALNVAVT